MLNALSHFQLQQYWWLIMSVVGSSLVFLMFVQGGQTLIDVMGKTRDEKSMIINSIGRKWGLTFTTLVVFAAGNFASFPLFYATTFGGAYYAWILFLFCFILQSVSYEFRRKEGNLLGERTYEWFLYINGFLGTFLLGVMVASFFTGSDFYRNELNLTAWQSPLFGLDLLFSITNISMGLAIMFLSRTLGALYLINSVNSEPIRDRGRKQVVLNAAFFLVFFLFFMVRILIKEGFAYNPDTLEVFMEPYKYLHNYLQMPIALILLLGGAALVIYGVAITHMKKSNKGIWFAGIGTVATALSLFWVLGYNNTCFYPSTHDIQSSLTIQNASSSHYTLTAMVYISLLVPVVIGYIIYSWRLIDKNKIELEDVQDDSGEAY